MAIRNITTDSLKWFHVTDLTKEDVAELKKKFGFHPLTLKDISSQNENPKIDIFADYLFGIFHFPELKKQEMRIYMHEVSLFVGRDYIVTIASSQFREMRNLFYTVARSPLLKKEFMSAGSNALFYNFLNRLLISSFDPAISHIASGIRDIEKKVYEESSNREALIHIANIRRNILNLKRILEPQLSVIHSLTTMENIIIGKDYGEYFDDIDDYAERVSGLLKNQKEILEGLHDTNESLTQFRTNRVIKALTLVSVAILPLTLFSGIYGMNIDLPFQNSPLIIWLSFLLFGAASSFLMYWIVRRGD